MSLPVGAKCILGYMAVYFSVNGLLVMAYLNIHLVLGSMQYILQTRYNVKCV